MRFGLAVGFTEYVQQVIISKDYAVTVLCTLEFIKENT
jgi:hypothetical protein